MLEPRIETIFCDDIREEVGNKRSLMGIYHSEMFVQNMPVILPRLCFYISYVNDFSDPLSKFEIKVVKGLDEVELITTGTIQPEDRPEKEKENKLGVPYKSKTITMAFALSPFTIEEETVIRVIADTESGKIYGPCLRIRKAESQSSTEPTQPA